jgi:formamidopyrimidine-DNA glycosylase
MPELPEVETVARDLRGLIVGARIVGADVAWPRTLRHGTPAEFTAAIEGRLITDVGRRGKQIVVGLSGDAALTVHLKMTGQLFVVPGTAQPDPYVRLTLVFEDGRELRFRDIRKFGRVGFYVRDPATGTLMEPAGGDPFADTGPEPLDPQFNLRLFRARLRARRGRLKPLIVDQSFIAGVGNIYADEALWLARLHPLRRATTLRPADERRLYDAIRDILGAAVERRGSSIDDYTAPEGDGSMQDQLAVYQRAGADCLRCGRPLRRIVVGGRATHFCSWCQRLPASDRADSAAILASTRTPARPGPRWTDLQAARVARTRSAAATRRARARTSGEAG